MTGEKEVQTANRTFYDLAAKIYEAADGRRKNFPGWLDTALKELAEEAGNGALIDLGAGTGWVARAAAKRFQSVLALDISDGILREIRDPQNIFKAAGAAEKLPVRSASVNCVTCFSVLHHLYDPAPVFSEIYRVLKKGGVFYSDHDLNMKFYDTFKPVMKLYRRFHAPEKKFFRLNNALDKELYRKSEYHPAGLRAEALKQGLLNAGFRRFGITYHWLGLSALTDFLFGGLGHETALSRTCPVISIKAQKD